MTATSEMQAWRTHAYGPPSTALKLDRVPVPTANPAEILVKVEAIPLNLNDLERIMGGNMMVEPELPYSPGMEVLGEVVAAGEGAEQWVGKRVIAITAGANGGFAEYAVCPVVSAFEMPADIPATDAATLFFPFHLAWLGLHDRANLQAGETVLIHAAAGGSGSAAIQLAVNIGATVIATAGSDEKLALCQQLGAQHVINYQTDDFAAKVLEITDKRGVDVVFDNVGEAVMEKSIASTAYNGRYVMMGFASNKVVADEKFIVPRRVMLSNISLQGVLLAYADETMSDFLKEHMGWNFCSRTLGLEIHQNILSLYQQQKIKPVLGKVYDFADAPVAAQAMADRETTGRSVILVN